MKHLRKFEGMSDPYYKEITYVQYSNEMKCDYDGFTIRELDFLKGSLTNLDPNITIISKKFYFIIENSKTDQGNFNQMYIRKIDDGWYLIRVEYNLTNQIYGYYKCDQFEGLIAFLKDQKILNIK